MVLVVSHLTITKVQNTLEIWDRNVRGRSVRHGFTHFHIDLSFWSFLNKNDKNKTFSAMAKPWSALRVASLNRIRNQTPAV